MSSNGSPIDTENSLEKIKRQLAAATSGPNLLQGPLLKRSDTLRKWNERWVILDPSTGKMEYKIRRNEANIKGTIVFDANSTIALSPVNFHGLPKYDGCCIYIGTPQKKDYFLCAETPGAAKAWVSTLQATQLVLKAHKEAINSLSGSGSSQLGTVATVVAAANSTALEASKEIESAMKISLRNALGSVLSTKSSDGQMDDTAIMKETLRVKDEELQNLARELRARDSTIKELAEKLCETAEAAEAAASAAHSMDEQRRVTFSEMKQLKEYSHKQLESIMVKRKESEEKIASLTKEIEAISKERDSSIQEAHRWRNELGKARERYVILEAAVAKAEEKARIAEIDAETKVKEAALREGVALQENQELRRYINALQSQLQSDRHQIDTRQVFDKAQSCPNINDADSLTKHVDSSDENVDKACLSISKSVPVTEEVNQGNVHPVSDGSWTEIEPTESRIIADVREVDPEGEGNSHDISVVSSPPLNSQHE